MRDHRKLDAFELADELVVKLYELTRSFPKHELYGITAQIRRSGMSVPTNITEGAARSSPHAFRSYLENAFASLRETQYLVSLAARLGYADAESHRVERIKTLQARTAAALAALIKTVNTWND